MEKAYKNISFLFGAILLLIIAGFYKTYFGLFPSFNNVTLIQHIHGSFFLLWFLMLIIQPILIRNRKYALHRTIGKFSYLLVPMIIISIVFIAKELYLKQLATATKSQSIASLFVPFFQIVDFVTLYLLAILNKRNAPYHMRYMVTTSLAIAGAGMRRIFTLLMGLTVSQAFINAFFLTDLIVAILIMYDLQHKKKWKPYAISLAILLVSQVAYYYLPNTSFWQNIGGKFAELFF